MNDQQYAQDRTATTDPNPSPSVWRDCPWEQIRSGVTAGYTEWCDFTEGGLIVSPTTEAVLGNLPMTGYNSSAAGGTYPSLTAGIGYDHVANGGGAIRIANTTDNLGGGIRGVQSPYQITSLGGDLWYECRLKSSTITTLDISFFAGLCETTFSGSAVVAMSATMPLVASTGAMGDFNWVGFHKPEANTTTFNTSYKADGVTQVDVNTGVGALVADTYVKLGMRFRQSKKLLSFYINGVKQTTSKSIPNNTGTDFPADTALGWVFAMGKGNGTAAAYSIDWYRIAQLRP